MATLGLRSVTPGHLHPASSTSRRGRALWGGLGAVVGYRSRVQACSATNRQMLSFTLKPRESRMLSLPWEFHVEGNSAAAFGWRWHLDL
jgi:hypothetical protein